MGRGQGDFFPYLSFEFEWNLYFIFVWFFGGIFKALGMAGIVFRGRFAYELPIRAVTYLIFKVFHILCASTTIWRYCSFQVNELFLSH